MQTQIQRIANVWPTIREVFSVPHTEDEYENLVSFLDALIDEIGENEDHPLSALPFLAAPCFWLWGGRLQESPHPP